MKIGVLVKQVPDTETKIRIAPDGTDIVRDGIKMIMNPYDELAVEQALLVKEKLAGDSTVTVLSLGPAGAGETIRTALAMGADRGVHLKDDAFEGQDGLATARALAAALRPEAFDLLFTGKMAIDDNASVVPTAVAELLDVPHVNLIQSFDLAADGKSVTVRRRIDGGEEVVECTLAGAVLLREGTQRAALRQSHRHHEGEEESHRGEECGGARTRSARNRRRRQRRPAHATPAARRARQVQVHRRGNPGSGAPTGPAVAQRGEGHLEVVACEARARRGHEECLGDR